MTRALRAAALVLLVASSLAACGTAVEGRCVPGESLACLCENGAAGAQVCLRTGGSFSACLCEAPTATTARDAASDANDAGRDADASAPRAPCAAQDIGEALGPRVATLTAGTASARGSCGAEGALSSAVQWHAPARAHYIFSFEGASLQAVHARRGCAGDELVCARAPEPLEIVLALEAGEGLTLYADATGPSSLSILRDCYNDRRDCNGDPLDGCETDTNSSGAHCGACRAPCAAPGRCEGGFCVAAGCPARVVVDPANTELGTLPLAAQSPLPLQGFDCARPASFSEVSSTAVGLRFHAARATPRLLRVIASDASGRTQRGMAVGAVLRRGGCDGDVVSCSPSVLGRHEFSVPVSPVAGVNYTLQLFNNARPSFAVRTRVTVAAE